MIAAIAKDNVHYLTDGLGVSLVVTFARMLYWRSVARTNRLHPNADLFRQMDFWGEHPVISRAEWRDEVAAKDTQLGYWEWLSHRLEEEEQRQREDRLPITKHFDGP